jgi:molybdopterin-guanine dinucleotide biosynthesis protein A
VFGMIVDALILAGGRSSRLGHSGEGNTPTDKRNLQIDGVSLLRRSIHAVQQAGVRTVIVVGDEVVDDVVVDDVLVDDVVAVREEPRFAGPVAAIAAGMTALPGTADALVVIACDMPGIGAALPALLSGFTGDGVIGDGVIAIDTGRRQPLAIAVDPTSLVAALNMLPTVVDASMRQLLAHLDLTDTLVPNGSTDDIDTWDDAARFGIVATTGAAR